MKFDPRTEKNILTLTPRAAEKARALLEKQNVALARFGYVARITRAFASDAEQDALYNQPHDSKDNDGDGRIDEADEKVTNAKAGESWHNYRVAWDITIFKIKGGAPVWDPKPYELAAAVALDFPGIIRGIDFIDPKTKKPIPDRPHYHLALGISIAQAQKMKARGEAIG